MLSTLRARISFLPRERVDARLVESMYRIYAASYDTPREAFEQKLTERLDVVALFHARRTGELVGFCGLATRMFELSTGRRLVGIYMGLSCIDRAWRGHNLIQRMIVTHYLRLRVQHPGVQIFAWMNALTVKTWLVGARNLDEYWPHPERPLPDEMRELRDQLGRSYYGEDYDAASGVVHKAKRAVAADELVIPEEALRDPIVRFYAESNPGWQQGDGLLFVTPGSFANVRYWVGRQARRALGRA